MGNWNQWSDETTEQLKVLWASGLSASRIACRIPNSTRNSILGKVHRLNLERRAPSPGGRVAQTREERNAKAREANAVRRLAAKHLMNGHSPSTATYNHVTHKRPKAIQAPRHAPPPSLAPINGKARHMQPRLWKARHASPVARPEGKPVSITEATGCRYIEGNSGLCCNESGFPWCEYHRQIVFITCCSVYGKTEADAPVGV